MQFLIRHRCTRCGYRWKRTTSNIESPDPPCPRPTHWDDDGVAISWCGQENVPIGMDLSSTRAPASIGGNIQVKAVDETARIVMEEHGMTDLRDDVRPGETMAPKLHPQLQAKADAFFGGPKGHRNSRGFNPGMHAAAAMQGAFVDRGSTAASIEAVHRNRVRVPTHIAADYNPGRR